MKAIVVGAGVLGAALARTLARTGEEVTLVEQHEPGDRRAASVAHSRLLRIAHGDDEVGTLSAIEARREWLRLEQDTGERFYSEVGMAWFAPAGQAEWEERSRAVLERHGVPVERLEPAEARALFPDLAVDDLDHVLLEREAGLLRPRTALKALVADARTHGAGVVRGRAAPGPDGGVRVDGRSLPADRVVWACGAWTPSLFPALARGRVIQQDVFYLAVPPEWATPGLPGWGEYHLGITGAGDLGGDGFKIGPDVPGPPADPEAADRTPVPVQEALARAYLASRFPVLADAPLRATESCQTVVLDPSLREPEALLGGEVRVVRVPEGEHIWLLGDGSGHAFKHAPTIANAAAALLRADRPPA